MISSKACAPPLSTRIATHHGARPRWPRLRRVLSIPISRRPKARISISIEETIMATIGFIGLGHMGAPMARNLLKAGHRLRVFDVSPPAVAGLVEAGATAASSVAEVARGNSVVITMLPAGRESRDVCIGSGALFTAVEKGSLLIDCSTIDVATARDIHEAAA